VFETSKKDDKGNKGLSGRKGRTRRSKWIEPERLGYADESDAVDGDERAEKTMTTVGECCFTGAHCGNEAMRYGLNYRVERRRP